MVIIAVASPMSAIAIWTHSEQFGGFTAASYKAILALMSGHR